LPAAVPADPDDDDVGAARRDSAGARAGDGAELRQPLGIAIGGGLILSQILTLYTTPIVYLYLDRLSDRTRALGRRARRRRREALATRAAD
jgi:hypothetical protein